MNQASKQASTTERGEKKGKKGKQIRERNTDRKNDKTQTDLKGEAEQARRVKVIGKQKPKEKNSNKPRTQERNRDEKTPKTQV